MHHLPSGPHHALCIVIHCAPRVQDGNGKLDLKECTQLLADVCNASKRQMAQLLERQKEANQKNASIEGEMVGPCLIGLATHSGRIRWSAISRRESRVSTSLCTPLETLTFRYEASPL